MRLIDFEAIPWESPVSGLRLKRYERGDRRVRMMEFSK
jgi:hypothetical protein